MGPLTIVVLLIGIASYSEACPGCHEVSPDSPVIHEYLTNTLQSISASPSGLQIQERIEVVRVLKAAFQVVRGIKFYYEFAGVGSETKNLYACNLVVVRRAWLNERKIQKYECQERVRF
ncbi:uncharacterized protein [Halyomorpha halys]|uniref:uncharacterized protein n=1 Tax=Halyomorpha halys TaxID=286706 RepID=UPI0006D513D2|nr:uncharacterized protein LOC106682445 [Halyomorpha halys]